MDARSAQSKLEILPDEILLQICNYLLCSDILQSFTGLNYRMKQMITQYHHYVSLHKTSISNFRYLCTTVFPQIGYQIRTLSIDNCYSLLQNQLFIEYFGDKMSAIFPQLKSISLVSVYHHEQLLAFLPILHDLNHFKEIRLYNLFQIEPPHQSTVVRSLFQANNQRLTTIFTDYRSGSLSFTDADCYLHILRLTVKVKSIMDLPFLFVAVPNIQYLNVTIEEQEQFLQNFDEMKLTTLSCLTDFRLQSINRIWKSEELFFLLAQFPILRCLSLVLSTKDNRLAEGNIILSTLSSTVKQFHYAFYYVLEIPLEEDNTIVASWPSSHPVACYYQDGFIFIHTLPWYGHHIASFEVDGKMVTSHETSRIGYDTQVQNLDVHLDKTYTMKKSLAIISQCPQVKFITFFVEDNEDAVKEEKPSVPNCSELPSLLKVTFDGPVPFDWKYLSFVLNAAPNLFRLDLSFNHLLTLFEDQQISHLLNQRITSLSIYSDDRSASPVALNEKHIPIIASAFSRLKDLFIDITHLPCSSSSVLKDDSPEDALIEQACSKRNNVISPSSSESMLLCLLTNFNAGQFISLCIKGQFVEELQTDPEQWLRKNTCLCDQDYKAFFYTNLSDVCIWL